MKITVVGLGPGSYDLITGRARQIIEASPQIWLRTERHPTVAQFPDSVRWESLDYVYDRCESFDCLYRELAAEVVSIARREGGMVYAIPGDPTMAEDSVKEIFKLAAGMPDLDVDLVPGVSFVEASLVAARATLSGGMQILEAGRVSSANPLLDLLIYQIEDRLVASDVKLELLRKYPADHAVALVQGVESTGAQRVTSVPLHDLDRLSTVDHLTALYVPAATAERSSGSFDAFLEIVRRLRAPDGCPWDREQTHSTLKPYVVEEAYEVVEAIDEGNPSTLSEELGDLLLQVVLHAQVASEAEDFDMSDVLTGITTKMVRRHPHVFGDVSVANSRDVLVNWETIKKAEKEGEEKKGMFSGIPSHMPALQAAQEVQGRAARVGFDWKEIRGVLEKVSEEVEELSAAEGAADVQAEMGDILFALVNAARHMGVNAEMALREANRKFVSRFTRAEEMAQEQGLNFAALTLEEQDGFWNHAKAEE